MSRSARLSASTLADRESVQIMLGDVAKDIQVGRLLTMHAAWKLDQGDKAQSEVAMAKIHVADTLQKAVDTAIQLLRRQGLFEGYGARMDLSLCALRALGRWRLGSPHDGARPRLRKEGR